MSGDLLFSWGKKIQLKNRDNFDNNYYANLYCKDSGLLGLTNFYLESEGNNVSRTIATKSNNISSYVDISSYTSSFYTAPCNGYVFATASDSIGKLVEIYSANGNGVYTWFKVLNNSCQNVFVPKGMKLKTVANGAGTVRFYKLDSYTS